MTITSQQNVPDEILIQILGDCVVDEFDLTVSPKSFRPFSTALSQWIKIKGWPDLSNAHAHAVFRAFPLLRDDVMRRAKATASQHFSGRLIIKPGVDQFLISNQMQSDVTLHSVLSLTKTLIIEHEVTHFSGLLFQSRLDFGFFERLRQVVCIGTGNLKPSTQPSTVEDVKGCVLDLPSQMHRGAGATAEDVVSEMRFLDMIPSQEYLDDRKVELIVQTHQRDQEYWDRGFTWIHKVRQNGVDLAFDQTARIEGPKVTGLELVRAEKGLKALQTRAKLADRLALRDDALLGRWQFVGGNDQ